MNPETMKPREPNVSVNIEIGALSRLAKELACDENVVASRLELRVNGSGDLVMMIGLQSGGIIPVPYKDFAHRYGIDKGIRVLPHVCAESGVLEDTWILGYYIAGDVGFDGDIIWEHERLHDPNQMSIGDEPQVEDEDPDIAELRAENPDGLRLRKGGKPQAKAQADDDIHAEVTIGDQRFFMCPKKKKPYPAGSVKCPHCGIAHKNPAEAQAEDVEASDE